MKYTLTCKENVRYSYHKIVTTEKNLTFIKGLFLFRGMSFLTRSVTAKMGKEKCSPRAPKVRPKDS